MSSLQCFTDAAVERLQNIRPDKDGATVKSALNVKNKIQIITLPDDIRDFWERFLIMQMDGDLIDPVSQKPYKDCKGYNPTHLKREFFRRYGWFRDLDFKITALHLLGETPEQAAP